MNKRLEVTLTVDAKTGEVTAVRNSFDKLDRKVGETNQTLSEAKRMFAGIATVLGIRELVQYADVFTSIETKVKLVTDSLEEMKAIEYELLNLSIESRTSLQSTADLYNKIARSSKTLGYTHNELLGVTQSITKAITISGDSATSADAALMQLGQGLASGALRGEELNSVMEQTPRLAQAIADGMGISVGKLREVAQEGKITSRTVIQAIMSQAKTLNAEFNDVAMTIAQSLTVAENSFIAILGGINEATGASAGLAEMIAGVSMFLLDHTDEIAQGFLGIKLVFQILKQDFFQLVVWIDQGIENIGQGWNNLTAGLQNAWKVSADTIGKIYYDMVNYILGLINTAVNNISDGLNPTFEFIDMENPFGKINLSIGEYRSNIKEATAETFVLSGTDWAKSQLNQSASQVLETYNKLREGVKVANRANKEALDTYVKGATSASKADQISAKTLKVRAAAAEKALAAQRKLNREYLKITGDETGLFQLDVEETMKQFIDSGEYSAEQLSEIYDGMWEDFQDKAKESAFNVHTWLKEAFDIESDSVFGQLFEDFDNLFDGFIESLRSGNINQSLAQMDLGVQAADMLQKSGNPYAVAIGYSMEAIGALLSDTLSEVEIKEATGRQDFTSQSLSNIYETLKQYQEPQLAATRSMLMYLASMDSKFGSIANAISSSKNGLDLDGSDFQSTASYGFLGFSSKQSELLGAGIEFGQQTVAGFLEGVDAIGYEAIKVTSSSFWGLVKDEKIKEIAKDLPDDLKEDISKAFGEGVASVMEAVEILGFDTTAIQAKLDQYVLDLGKLNFKDLSAEEQSQALSNAMSEQLDGAFYDAISSIASPQNVQALEEMARAGESYTETLVRAAIQHETVTAQLAMFGQTVTDFATSEALIKAAGGLDTFKNAMQIFTQNFFSSEEQQAMQKMQLEMALTIHNVALPASKAQFRALVLETQQKIIAVKTNIETMKAGIRADIEANNYKKDANDNYVRSAISTANNINQAAVLIGRSAHDMLEAAKGADVSTEKISYEEAYAQDTGLQALEAELANLESIYGTLMQNMGAFADYYGGVESAAASAASDAQEKLNQTRQEQIDLINKEIELRNKLNSAIESMKESVYGSFEQLLERDVPQLMNNLTSAINNKDYEGVSQAFNAYATELGETAMSKEEYLRGIISANAMVQSVQGQEEMSLLDATLATEANTAETAYLARIALGLQADTVASTEYDNKLDRNNELLDAVVKLLQESLGNQARGIEIEEEKLRDAIAADIRARNAS